MTNLEQAKVIALEVLEKAKLNLREHGRLMPIMFYVADGKIKAMMPFAFGDDVEREQAIQVIGEAARRVSAEVAIIVNDAYFKMARQGQSLDLSRYEHGDYAKDPERMECIVLGIKGPAVGAQTLMLPYARQGGGIQFLEPIGFEKSVIGLIPDWWKSGGLGNDTGTVH